MGPVNGPDPWRVFLAALPDWARSVMHDGADPRAIADVHTLISEGWDPRVLADYASQGTRGLYNAGDVMRNRLRREARPETNDESTTP